VVRGFLSSPRRRRRTLTITVVSLLVGGVAFSMVHWSNTSHVRYPETRPGKPTVVKNPVRADFRVARKEGVMEVAGRAEPFHHIDRNTLTLIAPPTPNPRALAAAPVGAQLADGSLGIGSLRARALAEAPAG